MGVSVVLATPGFASYRRLRPAKHRLSSYLLPAQIILVTSN